MCGRFTREFTWKQVHDFLNLRFPPVLMAPGPGVDRSYNVAPTQSSAVLRIAGPASAAGGVRRTEAVRGGSLALAALRWGLVPSWAKEVSIGSRMINARAETVGEKPAFRVALARRRCVVPMSGFYEWEQPLTPPTPPTPHTASAGGSSAKAGASGGGAKQPWYIHRADGTILLAAGLWERWRGGAPEGTSGEAGSEGSKGLPDVLETFTIVTVAANGFMSRLHDRMPALLEPEAVPRWLDAGEPAERVRALLTPAADGVLTAHRVSRRVNSPRNDGPELVREEAGGLFG